MRKCALAVAVVSCLAMSHTARADFLFSDGPATGGFLPGGEFWEVDIAPNGDFTWGSPGINGGGNLDTHPQPATDFEIDFSPSGYLLDPSQIAVGNAGDCLNYYGSGTTFCGSGVLWTAVQTGPSSVAFFAPAGASLFQGDVYFVDVFLQLPAGFQGVPELSFTGAWTASEAELPEPGTIGLLGFGLVGLIALRHKRLLEAKSGAAS